MINSKNILVVEDDITLAASIKDILEMIGHSVIADVDNAKDALKICAKSKPDLVLIDIQIAGNTDGIDLAKEINTKFQIPFIFTTAYADPETVSRAKEKSPLAYLVKPFGLKELNAAIEVAFINYDRLKGKIKTYDQPKILDDSIFLRANGKLTKVKIDDLLYIEAKGDYSTFKTKEKAYTVHTTISAVEKKLSEFNFLKVHRSYVINLNKIVDIEDYTVLIDKKVIPISRNNKDLLLRNLNLL